MGVRRSTHFNYDLPERMHSKEPAEQADASYLWSFAPLKLAGWPLYESRESCASDNGARMTVEWICFVSSASPKCISLRTFQCLLLTADFIHSFIAHLEILFNLRNDCSFEQDGRKIWNLKIIKVLVQEMNKRPHGTL